MDVVCFIGRTCPGDGRIRPFRQGTPIDSFTIALLWFCPEGRVEVVTITPRSLHVAVKTTPDTEFLSIKTCLFVCVET